MRALAGSCAGALVGLGLFVLAAGRSGAGVPRLPSRPPWAADRALLRAGLGVGASVVAWWSTGWPAGAAVAAVGGAALPSLAGSRARRAAAVARIEAIATWAEQLRDVLAAAAGIQEAIVATAPLAPAPIAAEVRRLAESLATRRERLAPALARFADEVAHPLADMVVTSLVLASERQGRLGDVLGEVARSARQVATMRLRVEAARARTYVTTRLIVGMTAGITTWLVVFHRPYLAPFDSAGGQVMVVAIGAIFGAAGVTMARMARPTEPARLLGGRS